jgi:hypothetical protein
MGADRIGIPYHGTPYPHKYPRWDEVYDSWRWGWGWWPVDRLCSVTADREGEFWTPPGPASGAGLRLNCRTHRAGEVRVGIEDAEHHRTLDCDPVRGDVRDHVVTWKGRSDTGDLSGREVVLHVRMRAAELFSVEWI